MFVSSTIYRMDRAVIYWALVHFVTAASTADDPCTSYRTINEPWRNVNKHRNEVGGHCDRNNFTTGEWYRFSGSGGNKMADSCVRQGSGDFCGTYLGIWLSGGHPQLEDGVVTRKVCGAWSGECCNKQNAPNIPNSIEVAKCRQGHFIYKLKPASICDIAYCTVHDSSDPCFNKSCKADQSCSVESGKAVCHNECGRNKINDFDNKTCVEVNDTVVICGKNEIKIAVNRNFVPVGSETKHLQLRNTTCRASEENGLFIFQVSLDTCGTTVEVTNTSLIYHNRVLIRSDSYLKSGVFRYDSEINVQCEYSREIKTKFQPESKLSVNVKGDGGILFSIQQFRSDKFLQAYGHDDYPLRISMGNRMYFQIELKARAINKHSMIEECRATQSADSDGGGDYYLIREGCIIDNTTTVYKTSSNTTINMSFEAFALSTFRYEVYLHCKLLVCDGQDAGSRCQRGCVKQSRKKRDYVSSQGVHQHGYVSMGPIIVEGQ